MELRVLSQAEIIELNDDLCNLAQLLDGWHADTAWSTWDEDMRYRVHVWMSKIQCRDPLPREVFSHPETKS